MSGEAKKGQIIAGTSTSTSVGTTLGFIRIAEYIKAAHKQNKRVNSLRAIALKRYQEQRDKFPPPKQNADEINLPI